MLEALQSVLAQVAAPTPALVHSGGVLCATTTYAYL
jgi:hypothetical protein